MRLLSELRCEGGLLKKIFNESNGVYSEKTAVAFDKMNKLIECLERKLTVE